MKKIGVVIPTRGTERKQFVDFCLWQLSIQTQQPDEILLINHEPISSFSDITARYKLGFETLKERGFDLMIVFEDDDYYSPKYIEQLLTDYERSGSPDIFGSEFTTYYHLQTNTITEIHHPKRASMCCTMMNLKTEKSIAWGASNYSFTDLVLWNQLVGKTNANKKNHLGIKHGVGLCGGSAHKLSFRMDKTKHDAKNVMLKNFVSPDAFEFYMDIKKQLANNNQNA